MKSGKQGKKRTLAFMMVSMLSFASFMSLAGYYIDENEDHIYVEDYKIDGNTYYLDGKAYIAYKGLLNTSYLYNSFGPPTITYNTPSIYDSLGGVVAPRATLLEAMANNSNIGLSLGGMRRDLMDMPAYIYAMTATKLTFEQSLGRASDGSLALIMKAANSTVGEDDQYALGVYGTYDEFKKAHDQNVGSITFIDKDEEFRVTIALESFLASIKAEIEANEMDLKRDGILIQMRPMEMPSRMGGMVPNAKAYTIRVFVYDDKEGRNLDVSLDLPEQFHVMLRTDDGTRSALVTVNEATIGTAEKPKWSYKQNGDCSVSGYVPAGEIITGVIVKIS